MNESTLPRIGVGLVHGLQETFRVDWVTEDLGYLVESDSDTVVLEFASTRDGGFINDLDILDQAQDIVATWDAEDL